MVRTLPTFLMKKAKQQVLFPSDSGHRAQLQTNSQTYYKVTIIYWSNSPTIDKNISIFSQIQHYKSIFMVYCLLNLRIDDKCKQNERVELEFLDAIA